MLQEWRSSWRWPSPGLLRQVKLHCSQAGRESNGKETVGKWSRKSSLVHGTGDKNIIPLGQLKWHLVWKMVHLECFPSCACVGPPIPMASFPLGIPPSWLLWSAKKCRIKAVKRTDVVPLKKPAAAFSDRQLPSTEQHSRKQALCCL